VAGRIARVEDAAQARLVVADGEELELVAVQALVNLDAVPGRRPLDVLISSPPKSSAAGACRSLYCRPKARQSNSTGSNACASPDRRRAATPTSRPRAPRPASARQSAISRVAARLVVAWGL
jgi:hypothetical protein